MFVTGLTGCTPLLSVEVLKNSKPPNIASSKALPCVYFLDVPRALIAYDRTFNECYPVPFRESHLYDERREIESAKFIPGVTMTVNNRYIRLVRLCIIYPRLLEMIIELNNRDPVRPNNSSKKICLNILKNSHIYQLELTRPILCVEGAWYALNAQSPKGLARRPEFVLTAFYACAIDSLDRIRGFLTTFQPSVPICVYC